MIDSKSKLALLETMAMVYPRIQIVPYVKAKYADGSLYRNGFTAPGIWSFELAATATGMLAHYYHADQHLTEPARQALGRDLVPGEIRIAFRPMLQTYVALFVDDVSAETNGNFLIETSPSNYQAHYLLSRAVTHAEALVLQRHLITRENGDPGAASPCQARRFPEGRFIYDRWRGAFDVDFCLQMLQREAKPATDVSAAPTRSCESNWNDIGFMQLYDRFIDKYKARVTSHPKSPQEATVPKRRKGATNPGKTDLGYDPSAVDFSVAVYLLSLGLDDDFIVEVIANHSPHIEVRHTQTISWAERTVHAAKKIVRTNPGITVKLP